MEVITKSCMTCRFNDVRSLDNGYTHCERLVKFVTFDDLCPHCEERTSPDPQVQIPPPFGGPNFVCSLWESD